MKQLDWIILASSLLFIIIYGIWKTRKINTETYIAGKQSPWWLVGISVMATQASAITFLSTPGQAYHDGLGFVQFYFAMPLALVILCIFVLPRYFKLNVYTAYEYLENRFGLPTRILTALLFLIQRGLACGITIFAPAIVLSTILGWNLFWTNVIIGICVIIYTLAGGTEAVNQTQKQQMFIIFFGMVFAFILIVNQLPMPLNDALHLAGDMNKLNAIDFKFDLNNRYNIWSAFLGGTFLFLSYFGTDQSQVQRYISGENLKQARLGLLFNALFKIPMQFFILLTGVLVYIFFQFQATPLHFNPNGQTLIEQSDQYEVYSQKQQQIFQDKQIAITDWQQARSEKNKQAEQQLGLQISDLQKQESALRDSIRNDIEVYNQTKSTSEPKIEKNDKDYVFIYFILNYLPHGMIGLLLAVILSAAMSSTASELNALSTTTVVDLYKRNVAPNLAGNQYLYATRIFTLIWGILAIFFAVKASLFENLIQAVNIIGSLFYGTILGVFALAFLFPKIKGKAVMFAILIVEPFIILLYLLSENIIQTKYIDIDIGFLWLNPIGCLLMILGASLLQRFFNN